MSFLEIIFSAIPIAIALVTGIVTLWRHIDSRFDSLRDQLLDLTSREQIEKERIDGKLEMLEYRINANTELIQHKARRLEAQISEFAGFMQKHGFISRSGYERPD